MTAINLKIKALLMVSIATLVSACYFTPPQSKASRPRAVPPQDVRKFIRAIPSYTRFGYSGLAFFNNKLYASSNIGLLEFEGGVLSVLYKWKDSDDVISGPWLDAAGNSLWAKHDGFEELIHFNGTDWKLRELPRPEEGYSRGDMLEGFRGAGTPEGFWLEGGDHAWLWDSQKTSWKALPMPQDFRLARIIPLNSKMLTINRHELLPFLVKPGDKLESDVVHEFEDQQREVPNKTGQSFLAAEIVVVRGIAYLLTVDRQIFRVTPTEITKLTSPGECEAIAATTSGALLASLRYSGIYEFTDIWQKRFQSPYSDTQTDHWAYLTESDGRVAFAITPKPHGHGDDVKFTGQTTLWLSQGSELKPVTIGNN